MRIIITVTLLAIMSITFSQNITRTVVDSETLTPLPFATILLDTTLNTGTISDIDGVFQFEKGEYKIGTVSYVGYNKSIIEISKQAHDTIRLDRKSNNLDEIVVLPGENPAHKIIRKIKLERYKNNPDNFNYFSCKEYNKLALQFDAGKGKLDSIALNNIKKFKDKYIIFSENIYEKHYKRPNLHKLILKASRTNILKDHPLVLPNESIQPFHFYDDFIVMYEKKYSSPIGKGCFSRYRYILRDSLIIKNRKTYTIEYYPKSKLRYGTLKGVLHVDSESYALQNVIAEPSRAEKAHLKIEQKYSQIEDNRWFPTESNYILSLEYDFGTKSVLAQYNSKTYITDIDFIEKNERFNSISTVIDNDVLAKDSLYWEQQRTKPLTTREVNSYHWADTSETTIDKTLFFVNKLSEGKMAIKKFDLDILRLFNENEIEGDKYGIGLWTNERLSERISIGGYASYGKRDKVWKYGGSFTLNLHQRSNLNAEISYLNDYSNSVSQSDITNYLIFNKDKYEQSKFKVSAVIGYFDLELSFAKQRITSFKTFNSNPNKDNNYSEIEFKTNFNYYKRYMQNPYNRFTSQKMLSNSEIRYIPSFDLSYRRGIKNLLNGEYNYNSVELGINGEYTIPLMGQLNIRAEAGVVDGDISYSKLFTGRTIYSQNTNFYLDNTFHTVKPNEFEQTRYANIFFKYTIGTLPFRSKRVAPRFSLVQNIGYSTIDKDIKEQNPNLQSMEKGLFESGILIDDIYRHPIFGIMYIGGGVGLFYRYGEYKLDNDRDNLSIKASIKVTF